MSRFKMVKKCFEFSKTMQRCAAFTLAEVMLVVGIIGIIAEITIPPLINNIHQAQYNVGAWNAYKLLSNAVQKIQADNGTLNLKNRSALRSDLCNVLSCTVQDTTPNICGSTTYRYYKSSSSLTFAACNGAGVGFILNNGIYVNEIVNVDSTCSSDGVNMCADISIDINGPNGPNMMGMDYYVFYIVLNNGTYYVIPTGSPNDTAFTQDCTGAHYYDGCTYQRLYYPEKF